MSWIDDLVKHSFERKADGLSANLSALWQQGNEPGWTGDSYQELAKEGYMRNAIAFRCIEELSTALGSIPFQVRQVIDGQPGDVVWNHRLSLIFKRPNRYQSWAQFAYTLSHHLDIGGECFVNVIKDSQGQPIELHLRRPDRMKVEVGPDGPKKYIFRTKDYRELTWEVDAIGRCDILHIIGTFNPDDEWRGLSPLKVALKDFNIHNQFAKWNNRVLENDWRPGLVIESDVFMSPEQENEVERMATEERVGADNAASPLVLRKGLHVKQFGYSPKDIDWTEGRRQAARDICHPFQMSPLMINLPGDSTYSNYKEARVAFWEGPVRWRYSRIEEAFNVWLLPMFTTAGASTDVIILANLDDTPAVMEREDKLWRRQAEAKDILTVDERREVVGKAALPDGQGDLILVGGSLTPITDFAPGAPPRERGGSDGDDKSLEELRAQYEAAALANGLTLADAAAYIGA